MKKLFIQAMKFFGVSGIGWIIDFCIFNLLNLKSQNIAANNMASSIAAVCFVFVVSTRKTFIQKDGGIKLEVKFALYLLYQAILILAISKLLLIINARLAGILAGGIFSGFSAMAAKVAITPVTMLLNFCVMKLLIEKV